MRSGTIFFENAWGLNSRISGNTFHEKHPFALTHLLGGSVAPSDP